jgi:hypothetical protein
VAKFADNGYARTPEEIRRYEAEYRRRAPLDSLRYELRRRYTSRVRELGRGVRSRVADGSHLHRAGRAVYGRARR